MPDLKLDQFASNARNMQAPDFAATLASVPPGSVGWAAAGVAILVAAGQRRAGIADAKFEMKALIEKEAGAVAQLAGDLDIMSAEIKSLKGETSGLRTKLRIATEKLNAKELEISHERLKLADKELKLNRELEKMTNKLKQGDDEIKQLKADLKETQQIRNQLIKATEKLQEMESDLAAARGADEDEISRMEEEFNFFMQEVAPPLPKEPKPVLEVSAEDPKPVRVNGYTQNGATTILEAPAVSKKATKAKKATATKRTIQVKKSAKKGARKENVVAEVAAPPAPKPKASSKTKGTKNPAPKSVAEAAVPAQATQSSPDNWASLSDSTLLRKTVKELTAYLEAKEMDTTDENGKRKKKALLVEAIKTM